ncbi:DUF935 family protein [Aquimarina sp. TRL1]|uniref:phage portal protein family protein n=1 Tax=Aquimarina sp. (strain TRL1) TaxID=2736252 RepID=UPI0015886003|nr:DUF935 family protein [Aquimarina sp. TRL1]QKX04872.1 DUF935 family protein [Aquimarina sp. TRL1]
MENITINNKAMPGNTLELAKKAQEITLDLAKVKQSVYRREINHHQRARMMRQSANPKTYLQQEVYKDAMMDSHLTAVIENRILRIQNRRFVITNNKGVTISDKNKIIEKKWFSDLLRYLMESIFFEYSLMQILKEGNEIKAVRNIERANVIPDTGMVVKNITDDKGLDFTAFPDDLLFAKLHQGHGLLEKAVPLTILKRHSWASWDEFEQIFGIPIRIAKISSTNDKVKQEVAQWLEQMGKASHAVFPTTAEIEIKENKNQDAFQVFFKKIEAVDSQVSILINGQTMTVKDGSSKSQAEVHERTEEEITKADLKNCLFWLNDHLVPVLRRLGHLSEEERIGTETSTDPLERIKTDQILMKSSGFRLTKQYLEITYGAELEEKPKKIKTPQSEKKN